MFKKLITKILPNKPVSKLFGFDRGTPIDRYYIEKFLHENRCHIKGTVVEVADSQYTYKYGSDLTNPVALKYSNDSTNSNTINADLATGQNIPENFADCFILTQTLPFIYDLNNAVVNSVKILRPEGVLLVTVPGITQISRYDMDRWGQYWSFTDLSLKKIYSNVVPEKNIEVKTYGNVKAAASFLYGYAQNDLSTDILDNKDDDYQMIIAARIIK